MNRYIWIGRYNFVDFVVGDLMFGEMKFLVIDLDGVFFFRV